MDTILRARYLVFVLVGLIVISCAPIQTTTKPDTQEPIVQPTEENSEALYAFALEYYKQGNYDATIEKLDAAIKAKPDYYAAYILLAKSHRKKCDLVNAEATYNKVKKVDPMDPRAYEGLAALYAETKRYSEAIVEYQSGLMIDSTNVNLLNGLGYIYTKTKEYDKALLYYTKSEKYEPDNLSTQLAIAKVYIEMDKPNQAVEYFENLVKLKPKNLEVRENLAETLTDLKRYSKAAQQYEYLVEKEPDNYLYRLKLGLVYQRQKKYTSAETQYKEAQKLEPDKALPLFYIADLNISRGKYGAAESYIKQAQKIEPNNLYANILLGDIYERRGYASKTVWDKNKAKKNCSKLHTALSNLRSAVAYYSKARADSKYSTYAANEITRCNKWIKGLEEDKWFYCK